MIIQAFFGSSQTGVGYQFFDSAGVLLGSRVTSGITAIASPVAGGYVADATVPSGAVGVVWDSIETTEALVEDLREALSGAAILEDTGTTLPDAIAAIDAGAGSGAYGVTVTVTDGTDPLEGAAVRATQNGITRAIGTTDASGNVTFALDAGTFTVALTLAGYQFTPSTRTVTGEETGTLTDDLEMTAVVAPSPPADASLCLVYLDAEDIENTLSSGLEIDFELVGGPAKSDRFLDVVTVATMTTNASGHGEISLQRNDQLTPTDTYYRVSCKALGLDRATLTLEASTYNLASLIT